ncbi:MAG: hypothetical protein ABUT20_14495, partial [Bacteroidota bacterium]
MKTRLTTSLLCVLFFSMARAQTVDLSITIKSTGKDSIPNTTIQLYSVPDTVLLQSQVSTQSTTIFAVKKFSHYLIKLSAIGFETKQQDISTADKPVLLTMQLNAAT